MPIWRWLDGIHYVLHLKISNSLFLYYRKLTAHAIFVIPVARPVPEIWQLIVWPALQELTYSHRIILALPAMWTVTPSLEPNAPQYLPSESSSLNCKMLLNSIFLTSTPIWILRTLWQRSNSIKFRTLQICSMQTFQRWVSLWPKSLPVLISWISSHISRAMKIDPFCYPSTCSIRIWATPTWYPLQILQLLSSKILRSLKQQPQLARLLRS